MERLTEKHYLGTDHYMKCSGNCHVDMDCIDCPSFDCLVERLAAYEDTGLTPERCAEFALRPRGGAGHRRRHGRQRPHDGRRPDGRRARGAARRQGRTALSRGRQPGGAESRTPGRRGPKAGEAKARSRALGDRRRDARPQDETERWADSGGRWQGKAERRGAVGWLPDTGRSRGTESKGTDSRA